MNTSIVFDHSSSRAHGSFRALSVESRGLGIEIAQPKIDIPHAPQPADANGFPSRGVYGNFLSHLGILRKALEDGLGTVWILEDDAIFTRRMCQTQAALVDRLQRSDWDICYFGHSLTKELAGQPAGLVAPPADFIWAHCYAVNARVLPRLVSYMDAPSICPRATPTGASSISMKR
jgi:glycosyl transferase, family 25